MSVGFPCWSLWSSLTLCICHAAVRPFRSYAHLTEWRYVKKDTCKVGWGFIAHIWDYTGRSRTQYRVQECNRLCGCSIWCRYLYLIKTLDWTKSLWVLLHFRCTRRCIRRCCCIYHCTWYAAARRWEVIVAIYTSLIARFMRPIWGPPGTDRTQVGPMLAPWTLLSGMLK